MINAAARLLMNSCIVSWPGCHHHIVDNKTNRLPGSYSLIVYSDIGSSYEDLLDKDEGVSIYDKKCISSQQNCLKY